MSTKVAYYGVVQDGEGLAVVGYDTRCQIVTKPVKRFEMSTEQLLKAIEFCSVMDRSVK